MLKLSLVEAGGIGEEEGLNPLREDDVRIVGDEDTGSKYLDGWYQDDLSDLNHIVILRLSASQDYFFE